jgi:uncharacterized protein
MSLPAKLRNFNLFVDGTSFIGVATEITLPKLSRKMEEYQGAGMSGPIQIDQGQEPIELEWTCGGLVQQVLKQYANRRHDGVLLRFAGAYQRADADSIDALEIVVRGRHKEFDFGSAKAGEETEFKITTAASYYKLSINNDVVIEFDFLNMIEKVNGTDNLSQIRQAIGI